MRRFVAEVGCAIAALALVIGCGSGEDEGNEPGPPTTDAEVLGEPHAGQYHLGPVDFAETEWHNACAPAGGYRSALHDATGLGGEYLAGVSNEYSQSGGVCDACILIKTAMGHSIVARVVTYGIEQEPGDIDVSPSVYDAINEDEFPRSMTWEFAKCPDTGALSYEFKSGSNPFWTALWVRNPRVPVTNVEVQADGDAAYVTLARETDGSVVDASGFGSGDFTLRVTGMDGQVVTETRSSSSEGALVAGSAQFE